MKPEQRCSFPSGNSQKNNWEYDLSEKLPGILDVLNGSQIICFQALVDWY